MHNFTVVTTPKADSDQEAILHEVDASPYIASLTRAELEALISSGTIRFLYAEQGLVGCGAWNAFGKRWVELGPFYVMQAHRGTGAGRLLLKLVVDTNLEQGNFMYGVTKNSIVKKMFENQGFHQMSVLRLPKEVTRHLLKKVTLRRLCRWVVKAKRHESAAHFIRTG
jgi:GNAT superfamily N-acetyltransferase